MEHLADHGLHKALTILIMKFKFEKNSCTTITFRDAATNANCNRCTKQRTRTFIKK
jgi:hypothetical protein